MSQKLTKLLSYSLKPCINEIIIVENENIVELVKAQMHDIQSSDENPFFNVFETFDKVKEDTFGEIQDIDFFTKNIFCNECHSLQQLTNLDLAKSLKQIHIWNCSNLKNTDILSEQFPYL